MSEDLGRGRALARPAFPDDDGSARHGIDGILAAIRDGDDAARRAAISGLAAVRLLAAVVAVLDEAAPDGSDKSSHMAVVSMINAQGEKGLLAFTSAASVAAWDPQARPVPALARDVALAALNDGAVALVIDVSGPNRTVVTGDLLTRLARDA